MNGSDSNNFWLMLEMMTRRKKLIISVVLTVTFLSVVVAFVLPKWYRASALLLPPKSVSIPVSAVAGWSEAISVTGGLNLPERVTPSDIYVRILKSKTVVSRVVERFELTARYKTNSFEATYLAVMDHADIKVSEEGLLIVAFEDKDPQLAADIANAFVEELERAAAMVVSDRIEKTRKFLSGRLEQVKEELDSSRQALEAFQTKYKTVDFGEQTRLAIEQAAALKVKLAEVEFQIRFTALNLGKDNVELVKLESRRDIIKKQLRQLETENTDSSFFSLPVSSIPSLRGQYEMLYSRVRVAEALYQMVLSQTEQAKVKEYESLPSVSVLDKAQPPTLKSRPRRGLIVGLSFGLSVIFAIFLGAGVEYLARLRETSPADHGRLMMFVDSFFGWLPGVKKPGKAARGTSEHT